jgi:ribA/ribD-fused uncharacterized protein
MPPTSLAELIERVAAGEAFAYLPFWGHRPRADGVPSATCLSQWFEAPFVVNDIRYATAEHWMMAEKARLFGDKVALAKILAAASPGAAKAYGREVVGFDHATWEARCFDIVVAGNREKFTQQPVLGEYLRRTGDKVLVEASPADAIWGIGLAADDVRLRTPSAWPGRNLRGFALMAVRSEMAR